MTKEENTSYKTKQTWPVCVCVCVYMHMWGAEGDEHAVVCAHVLSSVCVRACVRACVSICDECTQLYYTLFTLLVSLFL